MVRKRFHGLKRPKVRADWSKWNLYNLSRMTLPPAASRTFFQQKWLAKSLSRGFHGNQIREGKWERMFDRRLPAVVPMDHRVLATTDGSDQAAGRGSGLEVNPTSPEAQEASRKQSTPYMHMTFWPTERRLDTAIWRALFSSSVLQARQFCVHGWVKVNGKPMEHPGYLLNPGDMFQVEPDRVMYATGARKYRKTTPHTYQRRTLGTDSKKTTVDEAEETEGEGEEAETGKAEEKATAAPDVEASENPKESLKSLMARAKSVLSDSKEKPSAKRKQDLRAFTQSVKKTLSKIRGTVYNSRTETTPLEDTVENLEETLSTIIARIPEEEKPTTAPSDPQQAAATTETTDDAEARSRNPQMQDPNKVDHFNAARDAKLLHEALQRAQENPIDVRKPYATPWKPRDFMSAFAFIPRYLEVNQNICSAVYLRHPVARPGLAEVPSPFHQETAALAFNWYLRRR